MRIFGKLVRVCAVALIMAAFPYGAAAQGGKEKVPGDDATAQNTATAVRAAPMTPVERGDDLVKKRQYRAAVEAYTAALASDPNNTTLLGKRADAWGGVWEYEAALADCNRRLEIEPQNADFLVSRGYYFSELGDGQKAFEDYTVAINIDPDNTSAYMALGNLFNSVGIADAAMYYFSEAINRDPTKTDNYLPRIILCLNIGNVDQARADCQTVKELNKDMASSMAMYEAMAYLSENKPLEAVNIIKETVKDTPVAFMGLYATTIQALMSQGMSENEAFEEVGQMLIECAVTQPELTVFFDYLSIIVGVVHAESENRLKEFVLEQKEKISARNYESVVDVAFSSMGIMSLYIADKDMDGFSQFFDDAIRQHPQNPYLYVLRALSSVLFPMLKMSESDEDLSLEDLISSLSTVRERKLTNPVDDCNKAISLKGNLADAYNVRGFIKSMISEEDGLEDLDRALDLKWDEENFWYTRGFVKFYEEDYQAALDDFIQCISLNKNSVHGWYAVARCLAERGNYQKALQACSRAIQLDQTQSKSFLLRSQVLYRLSQIDIQNAAQILELAESDYAKAVELSKKKDRLETQITDKISGDLDFFLGVNISYEDLKQEEVYNATN